MKKVLAMILALVMALSLVACSNGGTDKPDDNTETKKIKVGFITLHDENSTYDLNFINAAKEACQTLGLRMKTTSSRRTFPKARSATTLPPSWLSRAATSSSPTALATSPS